MDAELVLCYAPLSCASVPLMALLEAGAEFTLNPVNLALGHNRSAEFERLNPKRKVPVLVSDGQALTENVAILVWLADRFRDAGLLPRSGPRAYDALAHLAWCASTIHPALTPNARPQRFCDLPGSEESVKRCAQQLLTEHFTVGESVLREREWFFEDRYTAADTYFYWCLRRALQLDWDGTAFPACRAHMQRTEQRASTQRFLAIERQVMTQACALPFGDACAQQRIRPQA